MSGSLEATLSPQPSESLLCYIVVYLVSLKTSVCLLSAD